MEGTRIPDNLPMQPDRQTWTDEALERELTQLPLPAASIAFREELRSRFVGSAAVKRQGSLPVLGSPGPRAQAQPLGVGPESRHVPARRRIIWGSLLAAALVAALGYLAWRPEPPRSMTFAISALRADATVLVDGQLVSVPTLAPFVLPAHAERVVTRDLTVRLRVGNHAILECPPGTDLGILRMPTTSDARPSFQLALYSGSLRVVTGPAFPNSALSIATKDARLEVVGTQFVVELRPDGTCICCREGSVQVFPKGSPRDSFLVVPQTQHLVLRESGEVERMELDMSHAEPLVRLAATF